MAPGGVPIPPKISGTTKGMTMKYMLVSIRRHKIIFFDITGPVCKLQNEITKIPIFGNATSRHANFTKFFKIINIEIRNKS